VLGVFKDLALHCGALFSLLPEPEGFIDHGTSIELWMPRHMSIDRGDEIRVERGADFDATPGGAPFGRHHD